MLNLPSDLFIYLTSYFNRLLFDYVIYGHRARKNVAGHSTEREGGARDSAGKLQDLIIEGETKRTISICMESFFNTRTVV